MPPARRSKDELPSQARWFEVPGCGHLMAWDDPERVGATILEGVADAELRAQPGRAS
jgi:pimeloyl-ACP methyl ester carboxylesterase